MYHKKKKKKKERKKEKEKELVPDQRNGFPGAVM
jgi:hypothetical protein